MSRYRVLPVPDAIAQEVRSSLRSPQYGHPAVAALATGSGPCRSCLRTFEQGIDHRILFTYNPFDGVDRYPEPGPIFVHRDGCEAHRGEGFPVGLRGLPLTLEAFAEARWMVRREHLDGRDPEPLLAAMLESPEVRYVHLRNTEAGCFIARVERVP